MKGFKKCYGVLSLLSIIFGFSLNACSDTSALQYQVDKIPLMIPSISNTFPNSLVDPPAFTIQTINTIEEIKNHNYASADNNTITNRQ